MTLKYRNQAMIDPVTSGERRHHKDSSLYYNNKTSYASAP